jgi:hypothetical protein
VGRVAITEVELSGMPPTNSQMLHRNAICRHAGFAVLKQPGHAKNLKKPTSRRNVMLRIVQYLVKKKKTLRKALLNIREVGVD